MNKISKIIVQGTTISVESQHDNDYISITDMVKASDSQSDSERVSSTVVQNWMRNRNTVEFLGVWESLNNPNFNSLEFEGIRKSAGLNSFVLTPKRWAETTNGIGVISKAGKQGGVFAHKDIAFEFGSWLSPIFKLYVIKEYQRLKEIETNQYGLEWNVKRMVSKANYQIHTKAVQDYIIPKAGYKKAKEWIVYADEADLLNIVVFGCTSKDWRESNPVRVLQGENIRDMASINDLTILSNMESLNSILIKNGLSKTERYKILIDTVRDQRNALSGLDSMLAVPRLTKTTYIDSQIVSSPATHLSEKKPD